MMAPYTITNDPLGILGAHTIQYRMTTGTHFPDINPEILESPYFISRVGIGRKVIYK